MANYYWVKLDNPNLTQEAAAEIFTELSKYCLVRHFDYVDGGHISYNTRSLVRLDLILEKYGIDEDEMEIEDEFERFYNSLSPAELKEMEEEAKKQKEEEAKLPKKEFKGFEF